MKRTVLITGAHGFLGKYVARHFFEMGNTVYGLGHGELLADDLSKYGLTDWNSADITLPNLIEHAQSPDVIVHCAGSGSVAASVEKPYLDFEKTVNSTLSVLEYIRTKSPKTVLVYPSSAAVYGLCDDMPINENSPTNPLSPYGYNKVMAETLIRQYSSIYNVKYSIVRFFSLYGPELRKQLLWDASIKLSRGRNDFYGTGTETRDWLHVKDAASLLFCAVDYVSSTVNGGSGIATTNKQVLELLNNQLGCNSPPIFSNKVRTGDPQHYQADIQAVLSWGWKPSMTLHKGIVEYAKWFAKDNA